MRFPWVKLLKQLFWFSRSVALIAFGGGGRGVEDEERGFIQEEDTSIGN